MIKKRIISNIVVALIFLQITSEAIALQFIPSEVEWSTWQPYCKARYVITAAGTGSKFTSRISRGEIDRWKSQFGTGWMSMHHYCAGMVILNRARAEAPGKVRMHLLNRVIEEAEYTRQRTPRAEPLYADVVVLQAQADNELGNVENALDRVHSAIAAQPKRGAAYAFGAILLKRRGDLDAARDLLSSGLSMHADGAAELNYILGLVCLDLGDYVAAQSHATAAADQGYPLRGLQNSLDKITVASNP